MNAASIIVLVVFIALVCLAVWNMVRKKKSGGGCHGCGGECDQATKDACSSHKNKH